MAKSRKRSRDGCTIRESLQKKQKSNFFLALSPVYVLSRVTPGDHFFWDCVCCACVERRSGLSQCTCASCRETPKLLLTETQKRKSTAKVFSSSEDFMYFSDGYSPLTGYDSDSDSDSGWEVPCAAYRVAEKK